MKANNNQKLCEVLEEIDSELKSYCYSENKTLDDIFFNDPPDYTCIRDSLLKINKLVNSALAEPPRNCDVGTADEQYNRHCKWCKKMRDCSCTQSMCRECYPKWAQMPYESGGVE